MRLYVGKSCDRDNWIHVKTAARAIQLLEEGHVQSLHVHHDLGHEHANGSGCDVILWIDLKLDVDPNYRGPRNVTFTCENPLHQSSFEESIKHILKKSRRRNR